MICTRRWAMVMIGLAGLTLRAAPLLRDGDRMVFLGDSITEQKLYTGNVMAFFTLRYPEARIAFRNAGWSGERADGGLRRLDRDVLGCKPTVVSICYGMNDGEYGPFAENLYTNYLANLSNLVGRLKAAGVRVVLLTPGCVDPDQYFRWKPFDGKVYNQTLARFAAGVRELAAREGVPVFDLHALMLDVQARAKRDNPTFTMLPDMIHPDNFGHLVMTYGLLKALGCTEQPSSLAIDAAQGEVRADRCAVSNLAVGAQSLTFTRRDEALPTHVEPEARAALKYVPFEAELNEYRFTVSGLAAGAWRLSVQGREVGTFTDKELAAGVNLALRPGPWAELGRTVQRLTKEFEDAYFLRWRQLSLPFEWLQFRMPEVKPEVAALMSKVDAGIAGRDASRYAAAAERTWQWELRRADAAAK
jgi:lysophospholipase L1-like esterase